MLAVLAAVPIAALALDRSRRATPLPPVMLALVALGAYLVLNSAWSVDRVEAGTKVVFFAFVVGSVYLAIQGLPALGVRTHQRLVHGVLIGVAIGALFLMIECLFGQPIKRGVLTLLPVLQPDRKHVKVAEGGQIKEIALYVLNRNFAILCLSIWPAFLMLRSSLATRNATIAAAALTLVCVLAVFKSEHETSMLAIAFSFAAFAGMILAAPIMRRVILAGWVVATLLVVPIASLSYSAGLHQAKWIPQTGRNRIILWGFTANEIKKAPLLGVGVAATKDLDEQAAGSAVRPADHTYPLRTGRHSHNIFMQTWYELGAVGALLLFVAGVLGLRVLERLPRDLQPYAYASFVSAVIIGAFSWGMWQTWFMAAFGIWALLLAVAVLMPPVAASNRL